MAVAAVDRHKRPGVDLLATPIDKAIAFGCNAPNPHNTQAWKFSAASKLETLFYVDEERLLPVTDPSARQIHIGCGCFIETLSVGATTMGFGTTVERFPEGTYGLDEIGKKPVARITLTPGTEDQPDALSDYVYARQTNRRPSTGGAPVSDLQFAEIARRARERRGGHRHQQPSADRAALGDLRSRHDHRMRDPSPVRGDAGVVSVQRA